MKKESEMPWDAYMIICKGGGNCCSTLNLKIYFVNALPKIVIQ